MLDTLITSKTRVKLLLKFFLNSKSSSYLRSLETELGESTNAIRIELNKFENANLLKSEIKGNKKYYRANTMHPLFSDIHNLILKHVGIDQIIDKVVRKLGDLKGVFLLGLFAKGIDNLFIDLLFVGENINKNYLIQLIDKVEKAINRKIRYSVLSQSETDGYLKQINSEDVLLLWKN